MENSQRPLSSGGDRRKILIVEDEAINREILGTILGNDYDVIFAENGLEALDAIKDNRDILSLVVLDLILPGMPGQEVLKQIKAEPAYQDIPVIVASGDQSQEIECLNIGASDFIQKPYPEPGVVLARVRRGIELFENRHIIQSTERDPLTGLYNREFFYSYAEIYDQHHKDEPMDAIVLDINRFGIINERFGRAYADEVLKHIAGKIREMVRDSGGIVCRRESDVFLIYCPHRSDYKAILDNATEGIPGEQNAGNRVRLRMGVYSNVDKSLDIERRFDRAKMAADSVRSSVTRNIGVYDDTLHKAELYSEQLIEGFQTAIDEKQFELHYQPKYDITGNKPLLSGTEGLVRWSHPELGMINPGVFIPLFEDNGLIEKLDEYVWREAAAQIREWKDIHGRITPVSVNVSRVDMYDANIVEKLQGIVEEYGIETGDLHLEITESAYAEDAEQIIETVSRLRSIGFKVEMDDFGTGYSSLNMLSALPIDVLKLDMKFIGTAFAGEKDLHMMEIMIDIARHLSVPVVAEGVETEEQIASLKEIGCDTVQGYYFSPPVPAADFAPFFNEDMSMPSPEENRDAGDGQKVPQPGNDDGRRSLLKRLSDRLSIPMKKASLTFVAVAFIVATALYISDSLVTHGYLRMEQANERFILAEEAANDLEAGSDYLTSEVRNFVVTGNLENLQNYFTEANETRRRDKAVDDLESMMSKESEAYEHLSKALSYSNELMEEEYQAMRLMLSAGDYDESLVPDVVRVSGLSAADRAMSVEDKRQKAFDLVYGESYEEYKDKIRSNTESCTESIVGQSGRERNALDRQMTLLLALQSILTVVLLAVVLAIALYIRGWIRRPLSRMVDQMKAKNKVPSEGAEELRFVSETYNTIFEENKRTHERLTYGNMHDALTGLFNRNAYNLMKNDLDMSRNALLMIDVDKFKGINDTYGHDVGDLVLKRVAEVLQYNFRSTDLVFRLGGDEFVIIMVDVDSSSRELVMRKIDQANVMLQKPSGDLPPTSLSVGAAFADRENPEGDIFKDADTALYRVKEAGRCGCYIY